MRRALASLAAAAALAGCVDLAPAYHRPPPPVPAQFPGAEAEGAAAPDVALVGWRSFFTDPKLSDLIGRALVNNRDLRIAMADVAEARAQYHVQRAALLPTLTGSASATVGQTPATLLGGTGPAVTQRQYDLGVGATWELDLFGRLRDLSRASQDQYLATVQGRNAAQITLVGEVAADYLNLAADRSLLAVAGRTLASSEATMKLTQARFDVGVDSELDVDQARTVVEQARFDVARLTTQAAQDQNALQLVVGAPVPAEDMPAAEGGEAVVLAALPAAVNSRVLLDRPDVLQAEDALKAANANIGAARAAFFPTLSLTSSGGVASTALASLFSGGTWSFAPKLAETIFDAGANRGKLAYAKAARDAALAQYEKAIQTAFRDTADALAERATIDEQLAAQDALAASSGKSLDLATAAYQRGAGDYLTVLIDQRSYYAAQQSRVTTRLAKSLNLVALYGALGGGLDGPRTEDGSR